MRNILSNPHVGLIFLVPGNDFTLRVNGHATITRDPELLQSLRPRGRCRWSRSASRSRKCSSTARDRVPRGKLWDQASWPGPDALPSMPCILYDQTRGAMSLEALEARNAESLVKLY
jgi:hypothetical protein